MKYNSVNIPIGTRDYLFDDCRALRLVQGKLAQLFQKRGFDEVISPTFEYYDVVRTKENPLPQEMLFKMAECTGRLLVLRPDITTPIARIAATKIPESSLPARLFYVQKIYRAGSPGTGQKTEVMQGGIELIGLNGIQADVEMIVMAVDALRACTDKKFHIEIGHAGFFKTLARELNMDEQDFERMRGLIENKNFAGLNDMLAEFDNQSACAALSRLSRLFGGEEVLDEAEELASGSDVSFDLKYLRDLMLGLKDAGVWEYLSFDLGLVHQIDYYTGIIIRGYIEGAGRTILSGGRYDGLIGSFGKELPANGFAIDVDSVAALIDIEPKIKKTILHVLPGAIREAFDYMDNAAPCVISPCAALEETEALATKRGMDVLVIGKAGLRYE